jgi:hypothetical protein
MHNEILSRPQSELLDTLSVFASDFYLAGGTAIALQIGHRRSIDYDLFTEKTVQRIRIRNIFKRSAFPIEQVLYEEEGQIHLIAHSVKLTFYQFPYTVDKFLQLPNGLYMPSLLSLAAMKTLALGGRAKWKDYVDLFFLLRDHFSLAEIVRHATQIFQDAFNDKLFREQLAYFEDIDFSEEVDYVASDPGRGFIQEFLTDIAISGWHDPGSDTACRESAGT